MRLVTDIYPALIEHEARCNGDTEIEALASATLNVFCVGSPRSEPCEWAEEFTAR